MDPIGFKSSGKHKIEVSIDSGLDKDAVNERLKSSGSALPEFLKTLPQPAVFFVRKEGQHEMYGDRVGLYVLDRGGEKELPGFYMEESEESDIQYLVRELLPRCRFAKEIISPYSFSFFLNTDYLVDDDDGKLKARLAGEDQISIIKDIAEQIEILGGGQAASQPMFIGKKEPCQAASLEEYVHSVFPPGTLSIDSSIMRRLIPLYGQLYGKSKDDIFVYGLHRMILNYQHMEKNRLILSMAKAISAKCRGESEENASPAVCKTWQEIDRGVNNICVLAYFSMQFADEDNRLKNQELPNPWMFRIIADPEAVMEYHRQYKGQISSG